MWKVETLLGTIQKIHNTLGIDKLSLVFALFNSDLNALGILKSLLKARFEVSNDSLFYSFHTSKDLRLKNQ